MLGLQFLTKGQHVVRRGFLLIHWLTVLGMFCNDYARYGSKIEQQITSVCHIKNGLITRPLKHVRFLLSIELQAPTLVYIRHRLTS